jgi:phosphoserine phosphatase
MLPDQLTQIRTHDALGVVANFNEWDEPEFVKSHCEASQIELSQCIVSGISRFDVPLFRAVDFSVALNATAQAREAADVALSTDSLTDLLEVIPWD